MIEWQPHGRRAEFRLCRSNSLKRPVLAGLQCPVGSTLPHRRMAARPLVCCPSPLAPAPDHRHRHLHLHSWCSPLLCFGRQARLHVRPCGCWGTGSLRGTAHCSYDAGARGWHHSFPRGTRAAGHRHRMYRVHIALVPIGWRSVASKGPPPRRPRPDPAHDHRQRRPHGGALAYLAPRDVLSAVCRADLSSPLGVSLCRHQSCRTPETPPRVRHCRKGSSGRFRRTAPPQRRGRRTDHIPCDEAPPPRGPEGGPGLLMCHAREVALVTRMGSSCRRMTPGGSSSRWRMGRCTGSESSLAVHRIVLRGTRIGAPPCSNSRGGTHTACSECSRQLPRHQ